MKKREDLLQEFVGLAATITEVLKALKGAPITRASLDVVNDKIREAIESYSRGWPNWVEVPLLGVMRVEGCPNAVRLVGSNTAGLWLQASVPWLEGK